MSYTWRTDEKNKAGQTWPEWFRATGRNSYAVSAGWSPVLTEHEPLFEAWQRGESPAMHPMVVTGDAAFIVSDINTLDAVATATSFWRTKPTGKARGGWECTKMVWSEDGNAWLAAEGFDGPDAQTARAKAAKYVCPICVHGDCPDPRHQ